MKRIMSIILISVIVMSFSLIVSADSGFETLCAMGILSESVSENNKDEFITREVFAYMAAKMMTKESMTPVKTVFSDVEETNEYSGYINYLVTLGVISGDGNGNFNPSENVTMGAAYKILTTLLGYRDYAEKAGGFSGGYEQIALELKLNHGVESRDGFLTNGGAVKMIDNALSAPMASNVIIENRDDLYTVAEKDKEKTIINSVLKMSVYSAYIDSVNQSRMSMSVTIIKNKYNTNKLVLQNGEKVTFGYKTGIDAKGFRYAPVTIFVDENNVVCGIRKENNVEIKVATITSINGDSYKASPPYNPASISKLTVLDGEAEVDVSENLKVYYNESLTLAPVSLIGKTARLVFDNGEVVSIEAWDLEEGGLITDCSEMEITYTKGETAGMKLRNFDAYKEKYIYIDGYSAGKSEIKPDSVFNYYLKDDTAIIIISEKIIVETLHTVGNNGFEIGNFIYPKGEKVYCKTGNDVYKENTGYTTLLGNTVKAYTAPSGEILYIEPMFGAVQNSDVFLGVVSGYNSDNLDEDVLYLKTLRLKPEISEGIYEITDKTVFYDGLTRETLKSGAGIISSDYVYEFEINNEGKIKSLRKPLWLSGYGDKTEREVTSFVNDGTAMVTVNSKPVFFRGVPLTFVYKNDSGISAKEVSWNQIYGKSCVATVSFFVMNENEHSPVPDLVLVYGSGIDSLGSKVLKYGVVSNKEEALDDNGEPCVAITVQAGTAVYRYSISKELGKTIKERSFLTYYDEMLFADEEIMITNIVDLSGDPSTWETVSGYAKVGLHKGTVERINNLRLSAKEESGTVDINYFHPSFNFFVEIDTRNPNNSVKSITQSDITYGDNVFYNVGSDGIRGVIVVR